MIVISPTELMANMERYLDLAKLEKVVIQRGSTELFELVQKELLDVTDDDDLKRAITGEQLLDRLIPRVEKLFDR